MKNINVIDFDKTLISYDSFRLFCHRMLFYSDKRLETLFTIIIRILKIINNDKFKERMHRIAIKSNYLKSENYIEFISKLKSDVRKDILDEIYKYCSTSDKIFIVSASPDFYIKDVAKKIGWGYLASHFCGDVYVHMYSLTKLDYVKKLFPEDQYFYNYSISDSKSDLPLLKEFNTYKIIEV